MMKITLFFFFLFSFFSFSQRKNQDTIVLIAPQIYDLERENFYQNFDTIDLQNNYLICYYDADRKYKIFEGSSVDGKSPMMNYDLYYLNGNLRESYRYNTVTNKYQIKRYYLNGDPKLLENEDLTSQDWGYNLERKLITIRKTFKSPECLSADCLSTVGFEMLTGDTAYTVELYGVYCRRYNSGQLVIIEKELTYGSSSSVSYPIEQRKFLHLKIDPLTHNSMAQSDRDRDRKKWMNAFDSLEFYHNLTDFSIDLTDTAMLETVAAKLQIISQFKNLRSITLTGCFTEIPPGVLNAKQLKILRLFRTDIRVVPKDIQKLEQLTSFSISYHPSVRYSESLKNLSKLPHLYTLDLGYRVDKLIPSEIKDLKSLKALGLVDVCQSDYEANKIKNRRTNSRNLDLLMSMKGLEEVKLCYQLMGSPVLYKSRLKAPWLQIEFDGYECFTPETEITLFNGELRKIKDLQAGDQLAGYNEQTKKIESTTINTVHKYSVLSPDVVEITCIRNNGEEIRVHATPEHPFFADELWVKVSDLEIGQTLQIYSDGQLERVTISNLVRFKSEVDTVYNLNTSLHTFFANGILVHNK